MTLLTGLRLRFSGWQVIETFRLPTPHPKDIVIFDIWNKGEKYRLVVRQKMKYLYGENEDMMVFFNYIKLETYVQMLNDGSVEPFTFDEVYSRKVLPGVVEN